MAGAQLSHDQLVQLIYDSVEDERGWTAVLDPLLTHFEADKGNLFLLGAGGALAENHAAGYLPELQDSYHQAYLGEDPRFACATAQVGRVLSDVEVIDQRAYLKTRIYNEWLRQVDIRYSLFFLLPVAPGLSAAQAIMRPHASVPFGAEEVTRMERLLPHVSRALRLRSVLGAERLRTHDLQRALDLAALPVVVLDSSGRLVCLNARAAPMLERKWGLRVEAGRLTAVDSGAAQAMRHALQRAVTLAEPMVQPRSAREVEAPPVVEVMGSAQQRLALIYMPLGPSSHVRTRADARARVLVALHDPSSVLRLNPGLIAQAHGLTPTEAQLTAALAQGATVEAFADGRGISVQTARTHLKRVLEKTGTRRQAELVRVMVGGGMHLGTEE